MLQGLVPPWHQREWAGGTSRGLRRLQFPYLPHFARRNPYCPHISPSFLPFPTFTYRTPIACVDNYLRRPNPDQHQKILFRCNQSALVLSGLGKAHREPPTGPEATGQTALARIGSEAGTAGQSDGARWMLASPNLKRGLRCLAISSCDCNSSGALVCCCSVFYLRQALLAPSRRPQRKPCGRSWSRSPGRLPSSPGSSARIDRPCNSPTAPAPSPRRTGPGARGNPENLAAEAGSVAAARRAARHQAAGKGRARRLHRAPSAGAGVAGREDGGRLPARSEGLRTVSRRDRPLLRAADEHRPGRQGPRRRHPRLRPATGQARLCHPVDRHAGLSRQAGRRHPPGSRARPARSCADNRSRSWPTWRPTASRPWRRCPRWIPSGSASSACPTAANGRCSPPAWMHASPAPSGPIRASSSTKKTPT